MYSSEKCSNRPSGNQVGGDCEKVDTSTSSWEGVCKEQGCKVVGNKCLERCEELSTVGSSGPSECEMRSDCTIFNYRCVDACDEFDVSSEDGKSQCEDRLDCEVSGARCVSKVSGSGCKIVGGECVKICENLNTEECNKRPDCKTVGNRCLTPCNEFDVNLDDEYKICREREDCEIFNNKCVDRAVPGSEYYCEKRRERGQGKCLLGMGGCSHDSECCTKANECSAYIYYGFKLTDNGNSLECTRVGGKGVCCYKGASAKQCEAAYNEFMRQVNYGEYTGMSGSSVYPNGNKILEEFQRASETT